MNMLMISPFCGCELGTPSVRVPALAELGKSSTQISAEGRDDILFDLENFLLC